MIYAYCICEPPTVTPPPSGSGLGGAALRSLQCGALACVYSHDRSHHADPAPEQVLTHERVVETIMARGPVLPLRFGTRAGSEEQLAALLEGRAAQLSRGLERVRGRVELGLRVLAGGPEGNPHHPRSSSGREYLLARVQRHRGTVDLERRLHAPLTELAVASVVREYPSPPAVLVAAYLVDCDRLDAFRALARRLTAADAGARTFVTGPWPPYNFAGGAAP